MSNKTEATFHGPPSDPWPAESLPRREPGATLADWDGYWYDRSRMVRESPPWVLARRREPLAFSDLVRPPPPPPPDPVPTPPVVPPSWNWPGWLTPVVGGAAGFLAFLAVLAGILALGLL